METPLEGTLDWYRQLAKTDPHIAALMGTIDKTREQMLMCMNRCLELSAAMDKIRSIATKPMLTHESSDDPA